jgi:hypothetical protein
MDTAASIADSRGTPCSKGCASKYTVKKNRKGAISGLFCNVNDSFQKLREMWNSVALGKSTKQARSDATKKFNTFFDFFQKVLQSLSC